VGLNYATASQKLRINAFYRRSQSAIDEVAGTLVALDDFGVLDLNASYMLTDGIEIILRFENAADASYREVADYRSAQRGAFVGIRLSL
jgi:outer membrane cobalamin receptor